ncbi:MAG: methylated-DNA--[protein]-cysteine S-methyltransferase [Pyrobaculum sp.]
MFCSHYGPAALGWDGVRIWINPRRCLKWVGLATLVAEVPIGKADWRLRYLLSVPRGYVTTYKLYAEALGTSPRHVGRLMASNPLPVVLPCHRVVRTDLKLGGYVAGVEIKRALLAFEGALCGGRPCGVATPRDPGDLRKALARSLGI